MRKKAIIIISSIIILGGSILIYNNYKREKLVNNNLKRIYSLINHGDFNKARKVLEDTEDEVPNCQSLELLKKQISNAEEDNLVFEKAVKLKEQGKFKEAWRELSTITNKTIRKKTQTEINEIKKEYIEEIKKDIKATNLITANQKIKELKEYLGSGSSSELSEVFIELKNKEEKEPFLKNHYVGISDNKRKDRMYFKRVPSIECTVCEYNPDLLIQKTFVKYYHENIEKDLIRGKGWLLVNVKDPSYGMIFTTNPNENFEFNMGYIDKQNTLNIEKDAAYCGIHGENVVFYNLENAKPINLMKTKI